VEVPVLDREQRLGRDFDQTANRDIPEPEKHTMKQSGYTESRRVNQVYVEFTSKPITVWGGIAGVIARLVDEIGFRSWVESHVLSAGLSRPGNWLYLCWGEKESMRTRSYANPLVALIFHNLLHYLNRNILNPPPHGRREQLKTLHAKHFIIPAQLGASGHRPVLRLAVRDRRLRAKLCYFMEKIHSLSWTLNCIAVDT